MYPTSLGLNFVPRTQEEIDLEAAMTASLLETTHTSYSQSTSEGYPDTELQAVLEASRLEAEREKRESEQARFEAMSRRYHQLPSTPHQALPSTSPTTTLSEADQLHLAELISKFEAQEAQKERQKQQEELARFANLSLIPTLQPSAPSLPYPSAQPTHQLLHPSYPTYPSTQPTTYPTLHPAYPSNQPSPTPTSSENDDELRQVELLSLREQEEAERLRDQQRQQEEELLATVMRRSEMERYCTSPHQMGDRSYHLGAPFQMPPRAAAPSTTSTKPSPTLEQAVTNAKSINKLVFRTHEIRHNDIGNPYLVLNYISPMHRMLAVEELRGVYHMFGDGKDPEGQGTTQLILNVEQTKEFQYKLGYTAQFEPTSS